VHQDGLVHVSALSHTFVKDPREVVKSGDVVRVKVLDVDIPRKRISLTLRLDDEAQPKPPAQGGSRGPQDRGPGQRGGARGNGSGAQRAGGGAQRGGGGGRPRPAEAPANTALADALRRAGLT
jgi:uncharacterized protein